MNRVTSAPAEVRAGVDLYLLLTCELQPDGPAVWSLLNSNMITQGNPLINKLLCLIAFQYLNNITNKTPFSEGRLDMMLLCSFMDYHKYY